MSEEEGEGDVRRREGRHQKGEEQCIRGGGKEAWMPRGESGCEVEEGAREDNY